MIGIRQAMMCWVPGMSISVVVAIAAVFLSEHYGAPVMLFALLLGIALNFLSEDGRCKEGLDVMAKQILRLGVALLGLRITMDQVIALGWKPLTMVVLSVALTIAVGIVLARLMGFKAFFGLLTGGAVAICGASAALALSAAMPNHPLKERATLFTVIGVSSLSTLAMMLYPLLVHGLNFSAQDAGFFLGGTIHDVAQVVGAGYSISHASDARRQPLLPWFAVAFIVLVGIRSAGIIPPLVIDAGKIASQWCLIGAMAAIGMKTHLKDVVTVGWKPVLLMVMETLFLALLFYGLLKTMSSVG